MRKLSVAAFIAAALAMATSAHAQARTFNVTMLGANEPNAAGQLGQGDPDGIATGFVTLDRLLARLHANKRELLMVLDRPEIPLHTNGSENDVRCQVTKRKVSGGTRSDRGRDCRDAFLGLNKTCAKLGIAFWDYLGSRLAVPNQPEVPYLPAIVRHRCATA